MGGGVQDNAAVEAGRVQQGGAEVGGPVEDVGGCEVGYYCCYDFSRTTTEGSSRTFEDEGVLVGLTVRENDFCESVHDG